MDAGSEFPTDILDIEATEVQQGVVPCALYRERDIAMGEYRPVGLGAGLLGMRHAVAPMIEICNQLRRHDFPARGSAIRPHLRDVRDHVALVNEAIGDLHERLTAAFEVSLLPSAARQVAASWSALSVIPHACC